MDNDTVELKNEVDKEDGREEVTVSGDFKEDNEIEFSLRVDISSKEGLIPPRSNTPEEIGVAYNITWPSYNTLGIHL